MPLSRDDRRRLRRAERAVKRMKGMDRAIFLAVRVDELSYSQIAAKFGIDIADVEQRFAACLEILVQATEQEGPWWLEIWPW